jgi:hypothetical protein
MAICGTRHAPKNLTMYGDFTELIMRNSFLNSETSPRDFKTLIAQSAPLYIPLYTFPDAPIELLLEIRYW